MDTIPKQSIEAKIKMLRMYRDGIKETAEWAESRSWLPPESKSDWKKSLKRANKELAAALKEFLDNK